MLALNLQLWMHSSKLPDPENSACVHVSGADHLLETVNRSKVTLNNELSTINFESSVVVS